MSVLGPDLPNHRAEIGAVIASATVRALSALSQRHERRGPSGVSGPGVEQLDRSPMTVAATDLLLLSHGCLGDTARRPALRGLRGARGSGASHDAGSGR